MTYLCMWLLVLWLRDIEQERDHVLPCQEWCNVYTCFRKDCLGCTKDCHRQHPPSPPLPPLRPGREVKWKPEKLPCEDWCNQFTCNMDPCAGCLHFCKRVVPPAAPTPPMMPGMCALTYRSCVSGDQCCVSKHDACFKHKEKVFAMCRPLEYGHACISTSEWLCPGEWDGLHRPPAPPPPFPPFLPLPPLAPPCAGNFERCWDGHTPLCCAGNTFACFRRRDHRYGQCRPFAMGNCNSDGDWLCPGWEVPPLMPPMPPANPSPLGPPVKSPSMPPRPPPCAERYSSCWHHGTLGCCKKLHDLCFRRADKPFAICRPVKTLGVCNHSDPLWICPDWPPPSPPSLPTPARFSGHPMQGDPFRDNPMPDFFAQSTDESVSENEDWTDMLAQHEAETKLRAEIKDEAAMQQQIDSAVQRKTNELAVLLLIALLAMTIAGSSVIWALKIKARNTMDTRSSMRVRVRRRKTSELVAQDDAHSDGSSDDIEQMKRRPSKSRLGKQVDINGGGKNKKWSKRRSPTAI